jgi:ribosomal protein S18 acetylase RimI-like enzyme
VPQQATFREAIDADLPLLLQMMRAFYTYEKLPFDEARARAALEGLIANAAAGGVSVIELNGAPVGYAVLTIGYSLEFHGKDAFVDELFIEETSRRQGVGRQALQFLEEECRRLGIEALHLEVDKSDTGAQEFYRRAGYKDHDRYLMTKWVSG